MNDRGGVQFALKAYLEEFSKDDDVELRLKINPAYCQQGWDFNNELTKIGIEKDDNMPPLFISASSFLPTYLQGVA